MRSLSRDRLRWLCWCHLALLWMAALSGCESPFSPPTLVEKLRILGIQAEPPTLPWQALASDQTVSLRALVADPLGEGRTLRYSWALCFLSLDRLAGGISCPGPGDFPLPDEGPTAQIHLGELQAWMNDNGASLDLSSLMPGSSFPVFVGLEVEGDEERVRALKRIEVGTTAGEEANANPRLLGIEINGQAMTEATGVLPEARKVELSPVVDQASRQVYLREGETEARDEDFLFSWFATAGEFADRRTILEADPKGVRLDQNQWTLPEKGVEGPVTLWVVLRDGRLGEDWLQRTFESGEGLDTGAGVW